MMLDLIIWWVGCGVLMSAAVVAGIVVLALLAAVAGPIRR
jgi:hypothetical protein